MALQQVEFEFPDEADKKTKFAAEIEVAGDDEPMDLKIDGPVGRETVTKPGKKKSEEAFEVEIVNDTPPQDRGKTASPPPKEVTDEELDNYSDKVRKRIQHFSRGYHDERRAKEQVLREKQALEEYTRTIMEENQQLKGSVDKGHNALIESAKKQVLGEVAAAKQKYKEAYDSGNTDAIVEAQQVLNAAQIRMDKVTGLKPRVAPTADTPLQTMANPVQQTQAPLAPRQQVPADTKAEAWREENSWFGSDDEMTAYALGYHSKIVKTGVDPQSDEYYEKINSRMRTMFPEQFNNSDIEDEPDAPRQRRATNVVAPATRSTAPRKVRLTESQVAIAKKLGVSLGDYAKQVANLQRNG